MVEAIPLRRLRRELAALLAAYRCRWNGRKRKSEGLQALPAQIPRIHRFDKSFINRIL
jgi:predicted DCC family thiol-disulfide oxidoreductase YuxK